jgi:hypothetical protein
MVGLSVMSGSDPHGTHNTDNDGGPSGPQRHGLELVRWRETRMSERSWNGKGLDCNADKDGGLNGVRRCRLEEWNWMTRVRTCRYKNNADEDGGLNRVQRHGLGLVRRIETRMSERTPERTSEWSPENS